MAGILPSSSIVLEWSADPLSDSTPTYTTVTTNEIRSLEWWAGIDREGNDPEPGGMTVTLKNTSRKWEPLFGSNTIDTNQRFRLTVNGTQEGIFFIQSFEMSYPTGQDYSEVTITCGDGFDVLAQDDLLGLDPPEADTYADVVVFDEPWGHWPLGDPAGTQAVAHTRVRFKGKGKKRRKIVRRWKTRETISEAAGVAGTAGVYVNTPSLGQTGLIVGDADTSVRFTSASSEMMTVPVETDSLVGLTAASLEAWFNVPALGGTHGIISLPLEPTFNANVLSITINGAGQVAGHAVTVADEPETPGSTTITALVTYHVVLTWGTDGILKLYLNGELDVSEVSTPNALAAFSASPMVRIGRATIVTPLTVYANCYIQHAAVYEYALSPERIMAHYEAGAQRGYPQESAGERIQRLAESDLWTEDDIDTTGYDVQPIMHTGQSKVDEIAETAHAEGPQTLFYFHGDGQPFYLGTEWQTLSTGYHEVQATFSDNGTGTPYLDVEIEYDNETYNEVLASHESGESVVVMDTASQALRGRRVRTEETDLLLVNHMDVETLANRVLELYLEPAMRPVSVTIDSHHALTKISQLTIGELVRVKKEGVTGSPIDRVCHIIGKRKRIDGNRLYTCTYTLARGFNAGDGYWRLGIGGFTEVGTTTVLG